MAMIKCPECGKEISDKADKCIHCGCPIEERKPFIIYINGNEINMDELCKNYQKQGLIVYLKKTYNLKDEDCKKIYEDCIANGVKMKGDLPKMKDSQLSVIAAACALFVITSPIGFIVACVDLSKNDKTYKHSGSWFAIIMSIIISIMTIGGMM